MSIRSGILWLAVIGVGVVAYRNQNVRTQAATWLTEARQAVVSKTTDTNKTSRTASQSTSSATTTSASTSSTPIESNVQGKTLSNTYYYHFQSDVPQTVRQVFEQAIATYNQTGIVKLVAGNGTTKQNQITFFVYQKAVNQSQQQTIELGYGGPKVIEQTGWGAYTANHAQAGINIDYQAAIKQSVATHELGHALGLDHSSSMQSVMYPVDQGKTVLTSDDLAALKAIYQ